MFKLNKLSKNVQVFVPHLIVRIKLQLKSCRLQKGDKNAFPHNVYGLQLKKSLAFKDIREKTQLLCNDLWSHKRRSYLIEKNR